MHSETTPLTGGVKYETTPPQELGWLDGVVLHVVGLGMPSYVQNQLLQILRRVDSIVSEMERLVGFSKGFTSHR